MKALRRTLLVMLVVWVAAEVAAPPLAAARIEARLRGQVPASDVTAEVARFPLLSRLLTTGRVPRVAVELTDVAYQGLRVAVVRYELTGVSLDRAALLGGRLQVTDIEEGSVTGEVAAAEVAAVLGAGAAVGADVQVRDGRLVVAGIEGPALPAELIESCDPDVAVEGDRLVVTCALQEVPGLLAGG